MSNTAWLASVRLGGANPWSDFPGMRVLLSTTPLLSRLGDCTSVYIDMGANRGARLMMLYAPHLFHTQGVYRTFFPNYSSRHEVCSIAFEPNPLSFWIVRNLTHVYRAAGRRVVAFQAAITNRNGVTTFYGNPKIWRAGVGASLERWQRDLPEYTVPTVSFEWFFKVHILPALDRPSGASRPRLLLKVDIESAEFEALPPACESGVLCRAVDFLLLEMHARHLQNAHKARNATDRERNHTSTRIGALFGGHGSCRGLGRPGPCGATQLRIMPGKEGADASAFNIAVVRNAVQQPVSATLTHQLLENVYSPFIWPQQSP